MKNFFYLFLLLALPQVILAQSAETGCGFAPDAATIQWMNSHHQAIERFHNNPDARHQLRAMKRVPLKFVAFNSGKTASLTQAEVNLAVANLNKAFQPMGIEFFSCHPPLNVLSSPYGSYLISEEKTLWQEFKTAKVINVFCVESIEYGSIAGYTYLPNRGAPEALFMLKSHLSQSTFAHEMGHYYGLYHTHGKANCDVLTDELVNDPNCARTGDDVCDTPADPNLQGLGCDAILVNSSTCAYTGTLRDKNGDLYQPNPRNIMSYSWPKCKDYFSPGQYERMQYFSQFRVYPEECPAEVCTIPAITQIDSTYNSLQLQWTAFAQDSLYQLRYRILGDTSWKTQNLTSNLWSLKNLKPCTKLEVQVRRACGGAFSAWTNVLNLKTQGCAGVYCASFGGSNTAWLNRISIDTWAYTSGNNEGYLLNQNTGLTLSGGVPYNVQFDPGGTLRIRDTLYWQIWVDKNRDRDFEDTGERVYEGKSAHRSSHKGIFTLPAELSTGSSQLRVILSLNKWASSPCDTADHVIETEDYVLTLRVPQICNKPTANNILIKKVTTNAVTLKAQGLDALRHQWEIRQSNNNQLTYLSPEISLDSLNFSGLAENTRYLVRLRTLCKNGVYSSWSDTLSFKTLLIPCPAPDSNALVVKQITSTSAQLTCGTQAGVINYQFYYRVKGTDVWTSSPLLRVTTYTITGLKAATSYEYRARVYCTANLSVVSGYSKTGSFQTAPEPCKLPNRDLIRIEVVGDTAILFSYSDTSSYYKSFAWRFRKRGTIPWVILPQGKSMVAIPEFGVDYEVTVQGSCGAIFTSDWSLVKTFNIPCIAPKSSDLTVLKLRFSHAEIAYRGPKINGFSWQYKALSATNWSSESYSTDTIIYVHYLQPSTTYQFRFKTPCKSGNWSPYSNPIQFTTPEYPCNLPDSSTFTASSITDVSAKLSCAVVPGATLYIFSYRKLGTLPWTSSYVSNGPPETVINNLQPNTRYEFTVQSSCRYNNELAVSLPLAYRQFVTLPKICPPVAHADIRVEYLGMRKMQVRGPSGAEAYAMRYRSLGATNWMDSITLDSAIWVIDNLKYPEQYEIQVKQKCVAGNWSIWSTSKKFLTPELICPTPDDRNIKVIANNDTIRLEYSGDQSTLYHWRMRIKGDSLWLNLADSVLKQGLVLSTPATYEFALLGVCANGQLSEWSKSKTFIWPCSSILSNEIIIKEVRPKFASILCTAPSVEGYNWRYRELGEASWEKETWTLTPEVLFEQLHEEKNYEFQVQRFCSDLGSAYAESQFFATPSLPSGASCSLSTEQVRIKEIGAGQLELTNSLIAQRYFWAYRQHGNLDWEVQFPSIENTVRFDSLAYGKAYIIGVRVICLAGDTTEWMYLPYQPACPELKATDVRIKLMGNQRVILECTNYNFISYEWRYRPYGSSENWGYVTGNKIEINQLAKKLYEVQVRGFCQQKGAWVTWSNPNQFSIGECKLPASLAFVPRFITKGALDILLESKTNDWQVNHFKWSYRELGRRNWIDTIITEEALLSLNGLIPGVTYEFKVEAICFSASPNTLVYSNYITLPKACFVPTLDRVKVGRITQTSAFIELDYNFFLPFEISYRVKGSQTVFKTINGLQGNVPNLTDLIPGTEYEMMIRINCNGTADQTPLIYFKTKSCDIPYAGAIVFDAINLDYVEAKVEFHNFHPPVTGLNYVWKYKLKNATVWDSISASNQNTLYLTGLQPESAYDLKVLLHCTNTFTDSIEFTSSFKTVLDKCSSIDGSEHVRHYYLDAYKEYIISCDLPSDYYFAVRYWVKFDDDPKNLYWEFSVSDSLNCGRAAFIPSNAEGQKFYFQVRIICPSGNYSPWSDTIFLQPIQPLVNEGTVEFMHQANSSVGTNPALRISPNPSTGQFKVQLPPLGTKGSDSLIEVFNLSGQKVYSQRLDGEEAALDLSNRANGLYFVRVLAGKQTFTERILLQKP